MKSPIAVAGIMLAVIAGATYAQAPQELSRATLGELTGFVQNAYFNANRLSDMPKMPTDRAATQPEVLSAVASALRVRQRACGSVIAVDYADDTGNMLNITCTDNRYVVDAKRGKITP